MAAITKNAELKRRAIELCRDKRGRITKRAVVEAARDPDNILHDEFPWDLETAAQQRWEEIAGVLIKTYCTVTIVHRNREIKTVAYVRDPNARPNEQGYIGITSKEMDRKAAEKTLLDEMNRCRAAIERARDVVAVLDSRFPGLADQLEGLLNNVMGLEELMQAAE